MIHGSLMELHTCPGIADPGSQHHQIPSQSQTNFELHLMPNSKPDPAKVPNLCF